MYGNPSMTFLQAAEKYSYLKDFYYNCFSVVTKRRTIDFEIDSPNKIILVLFVLSSLTWDNEGAFDEAPIAK